MQTHESQEKLARLIDQEIMRINQQQQQQNIGIVSPCQELLNKTTDLMNAVGYCEDYYYKNDPI